MMSPHGYDVTCTFCQKCIRLIDFIEVIEERCQTNASLKQILHYKIFDIKETCFSRVKERNIGHSRNASAVLNCKEKGKNTKTADVHFQ